MSATEQLGSQADEVNKPVSRRQASELIGLPAEERRDRLQHTAVKRGGKSGCFSFKVAQN